MNSRMPSLRRPTKTVASSEESSEGRRSQLPQLSAPSIRASHVSSIPAPSPTRATADRSAMPPPPAPALAPTPASLTRTQSTRTRNIPQPSSSLQRTTSVRGPVPQRTPTQRVLSHSRTNSADTGDAAAAAALKRAQTTTTRHVRSQSSAVDSKSSTSLTPIEPAKSAIRRLVRPTSTTAAPPPDDRLSQRRPNFNTLQQHYSPAKSVLPKPPVPSARAAPSAQEKAVISGAVFETAKSQSELLYLSLLHESAEPNLRSYRKSAHKALEQEFVAVKREISEIRDQERLIQEQANLSALALWLGLSKEKSDHVGQESAEAVQHLSGCLNDVITLSAPESKYSSLVQTFSAWIEEATGQSHAAQLLVGPLSQDWHHSHSSLTQRLRLMERDVEMLPPIQPGPDKDKNMPQSSLAIVLRCVRAMVTGMKEELQEMIRLERQIVSTEKERVSKAVAGLSLDTLLQETEQWSPAW